MLVWIKCPKKYVSLIYKKIISVWVKKIILPVVKINQKEEKNIQGKDIALKIYIKENYIRVELECVWNFNESKNIAFCPLEKQLSNGEHTHLPKRSLIGLQVRRSCTPFEAGKSDALFRKLIHVFSGKAG